MDDSNLQTLDPFAAKPKTQKVAPWAMLGGTFEDAAETGGQFIRQGAQDLISSTFDLFKDVSGVEKTPQPDDKKFSAEGRIEFQRVTNFYQKLEDDRKILKYRTQEQAIEDLVRFEVGRMSSVEKNKIEGLNLDLGAEYTNNAYHMNNIRIKKMEELRAMAKAKEEQEVASIIKNPSLLLNLNAQEGQSMTAPGAGAIMSAG